MSERECDDEYDIWWMRLILWCLDLKCNSHLGWRWFDFKKNIQKCQCVWWNKFEIGKKYIYLLVLVKNNLGTKFAKH